jgi:hypothetical protein
MTKGPTPALIEIDKWYETTMLPKRTTAAGFSKNRVHKSPMALVRGNVDDPNGLCGDVSTYVAHQFDDTFRDLYTTDGYQLGMILWDGVALNHIANVMLPKAKAVRQKFVTAGGITTNMSGDTAWMRLQKRPPGLQPKLMIAGRDLLQLRVYDLYYKMKPTTVKTWWEFLDAGLHGTVQVGLEHEFT